jgi:hypothetical protein
MVIPNAATDLHGYKAWRNSLVPFNNGTIFRMLGDYERFTVSSKMLEGTHWVVTELRDPMLTKNDSIGGKVYNLVSCSAKGKPFKSVRLITVEGIAKWLDKGMIMVVGETNV